MKLTKVTSLFMVIALTVVLCPRVGVSEQVMPGGHFSAPAKDERVSNAAKFAVEAQAKIIREQPGQKSIKLELVRVVSATQQVVAGMNYRLKLKVKENGRERDAEACVYLKLSGEQELTSWNWK